MKWYHSSTTESERKTYTKLLLNFSGYTFLTSLWLIVKVAVTFLEQAELFLYQGEGHKLHKKIKFSTNK